jgi:TonB family protein
MARSKKGLVGTVVFHAGLLAFAILFGFVTPLPLPEEEGILINFGTDDFGLGEAEPIYSEIPEEQSTPPPQEAVTPVESTEEIISQDFEEAPVITEKPQEKPQEERQEEVITPPEDARPVEQLQPPPPEEEPQKVNERALYRGRRDTDATGPEGRTQGEGNQGSPTGSPDSDNYAQGLSSGSGINFSLAGRNPVSLPKPEYNSQVSGTIVVRIRVDREGKVISAEPGQRGTNIADENLWESAKKAALKARFNAKSDAAYTQQGTITYHFVLQ